jgi:hypothetical protein
LLFVTGQFKQEIRMLTCDIISGESKCKLPCFKEIMGRFVVTCESV